MNDSKLRDRFDLKDPEYATTIFGSSQLSETKSKIGVSITDPKKRNSKRESTLIVAALQTGYRKTDQTPKRRL